MFQLVFKGECTPNTDLNTARNNARALFKASLDQVDKMFSGQRVVIRNKLDEAQAEKYRQVLQKHGMIAHVEPMVAAAPTPAPAPTSTPESAPEPRPAPAAPQASAPAADPVAVEPGDRLQVAGDKVDSILSGSGLTLDPVGVTLAEAEEVEVPMFEHLDEWTVAPAGSDIGVERDLPPPLVPDTSHLSLAEDDNHKD
ncbi:hypothetical protein [Marinobacter zhejiangensis]|uniref:Uncharacterized protein n=1 Tax=Marinobacter zhejiangensis TaxID=488535 RepID=A0A1I4MEL2_9GAMM|nr:hypothetical protein [Marinobacter zhejiangensis]SFM01590.1 hypothetical protein SAMN04487963_1025 [Marinobacter zhejiangensis]